MRLLQLACLVALVAALGGCTTTEPGTARPATDAFPDPAAYGLVDADPFVLPDDGRFAGIAFSTPHGQRCSSNSRDYLHRIWCYGPRFDTAGYWDITVGPEQVATVEPADDPTDATADTAVLAPGDRIDFSSGAVCVAGAAMFGCRTGEHGFVLTTSGARAF